MFVNWWCLVCSQPESGHGPDPSIVGTRDDTTRHCDCSKPNQKRPDSTTAVVTAATTRLPVVTQRQETQRQETVNGLSYTTYVFPCPWLVEKSSSSPPQDKRLFLVFTKLLCNFTTTTACCNDTSSLYLSAEPVSNAWWAWSITMATCLPTASTLGSCPARYACDCILFSVHDSTPTSLLGYSYY